MGPIVTGLHGNTLEGNVVAAVDFALGSTMTRPRRVPRSSSLQPLESVFSHRAISRGEFPE